MSRVLPLLAAFGLLPGLAAAQTVLSGDHSIAGRLCVGASCFSPETFGATDAMKLKNTLTGLMFEDTSGPTFPSGDWRLRVNDSASLAAGGIDRFSIEDIDAGTIPFSVQAGAPTNSLWIAPAGDVGLGTMLPQTNLHVATGESTAVLRLEELFNTAGGYDIKASDSLFSLTNTSNGRRQFYIRGDAPSNAIYVDSPGWVGLGTGSPGAPLELSGTDSYNYFRITASGAAVNQSVDITFTQGPLGTGQLRYNIVDGDNQEMSLDANGNMILDGTLTTGGPSCSGGCDAVFTEGQIIPERDYSAQMWAQGHLPHVGPTAPGEAFNMTEKMGGMLNALEHAHIYIERQREEIAQMKAEHAARIADLEARLMALEGAARP